MFDPLNLTGLTVIILIGVACAACTWMIRGAIANSDERKIRNRNVDVGSGSTKFKAETSEMQRMLRRNEEYQRRNDERIRDLIISVGRIEGHLFGIEPFVLRDISRRDSRPEA